MSLVLEANSGGWYNATMVKPFQFSLRRLFIFFGWMAVALASAKWHLAAVYHDRGNFWFLILFFSALGAGIGSLFGKTLFGFAAAWLTVIAPAKASMIFSTASFTDFCRPVVLRCS